MPETPAARYWLVKSEPDVYSFDQLWRAPGRKTGWDGVRNYQARNFMSQQMRVGDGVLYYHSSGQPPGVAGLAEVASAPYPDPTQFDPRDEHCDPASTRAAPRWFQVDLRATRRLPRFLPLAELRAESRLAGMELLRRGSRLSVQPVRPEHWRVVLELAGISDRN
ncbi:MAG: EVE domain-containing protein [Planctomycetes bacterium]|nr:EVE domain-containing protein [Planctomycetota bacterium]